MGNHWVCKQWVRSECCQSRLITCAASLQPLIKTLTPCNCDILSSFVTPANLLPFPHFLLTEGEAEEYWADLLPPAKGECEPAKDLGSLWELKPSNGNVHLFSLGSSHSVDGKLDSAEKWMSGWPCKDRARQIVKGWQNRGCLDKNWTSGHQPIYFGTSFSKVARFFYSPIKLLLLL